MIAPERHRGAAVRRRRHAGRAGRADRPAYEESVDRDRGAPPGQLVRDRRARHRLAGPRHLRRRAAADHRGAGPGHRQHAEVPDLREPVGGRLRRGGVAGDPARDREARGGGRERLDDPGRRSPTPTAIRCSSSRRRRASPAWCGSSRSWRVVVALVALSAAFARWRRDARASPPPTRTVPWSSRRCASGERSRPVRSRPPRGAAGLPPALARRPRARARRGRRRRGRLPRPSRTTTPRAPPPSCDPLADGQAAPAAVARPSIGRRVAAILGVARVRGPGRAARGPGVGAA